MKALIVFGTRPEAIKMAPVVKQVQRTGCIDGLLCTTGQHREMLDQVLDAFGIVPDFDLSIMEERQTLESITSKTLVGMGRVLDDARPDIVLVHGDTTSSMSAALAAFYRQIPVAHVEAGLRTYDRYSPYPEEMNRKLLTALATYHFAPTEDNRRALAAENVHDNVWVTGNTVLDSFQYTLDEGHVFGQQALNDLDFARPTVLVTAHRRENLGEPLENICRAILEVCTAHPECQVVYPVHLNPAVRQAVFPLLENHEQVLLTDPIDVLDMHNLMARCRLVMTDSGGLQEEAPFLGKPVLVLRRETEREEVIRCGAAILAGTETERIREEACRLFDDPAHYDAMAKAPCPYGDGHASERIVNALAELA